MELQEGVSTPLPLLKLLRMRNAVTDLLSWILRLGALVILLDVAVDPFSQQLVQLRQDLVYSEDGETVLSSAGRYSRGSWFRLQTAPLITSKALVRSIDYMYMSNSDCDQRRLRTPI